MASISFAVTKPFSLSRKKWPSDFRPSKKKKKYWEISDGFILYLGTKVSSSKSWYSLVRPTIKIKCMWRCTAKAVKSFKILTTFSSLFLKFHIKGKKKKQTTEKFWGSVIYWVKNNWEILRQCYLLSESIFSALTRENIVMVLRRLQYIQSSVNCV